MPSWERQGEVRRWYDTGKVMWRLSCISSQVTAIHQSQLYHLHHSPGRGREMVAWTIVLLRALAVFLWKFVFKNQCLRTSLAFLSQTEKKNFHITCYASCDCAQIHFCVCYLSITYNLRHSFMVVKIWYHYTCTSII